MYDWKNIATIKTQHKSGACNGGWAYDAYPDLETLDAHKAITIAEIKGPAVITCIHVTQHSVFSRNKKENMTLAARGIILEVYFNEVDLPAVRVPLADFFADGCGGRAEHFSSLFVEKAPESYNCFIPMPFEKSARVVLRNETSNNYSSYSFVEYEQLPVWERNIGYFHATWSRFAFQLNGNTNRHFFHIDGSGHLLGRAWSICTDEPYFHKFHYIMEGNNEIRIDDEKEPRIDYLGTEDSFGFSWGFNKTYSGLYNGMNCIDRELLSIYRFHGPNVIRFNKNFDLRINWSNEFKNNEKFHKEIVDLFNKGRGWVDYATTYYWYQEKVGYPHEELPSLEDRCKTILKPFELSQF